MTRLASLPRIAAVGMRAGLAEEYLAKGFWEGITVAQALGRTVRDHWRRVALVRGGARGLGWPGAGA